MHITACEDNTARFWDVESSEPLLEPLHGTVQVRELDCKDLPQGDRERHAELLGGNRIGANAGGRVPLDARELQRLWNERGK